MGDYYYFNCRISVIISWVCIIIGNSISFRIMIEFFFGRGRREEGIEKIYNNVK